MLLNACIFLDAPNACTCLVERAQHGRAATNQIRGSEIDVIHTREMNDKSWLVHLKMDMITSKQTTEPIKHDAVQSIIL